MKTSIKTFIFITLVFLSSTVFAQTTKQEKVDIIIENCINSLSHNNQGVIESAIFVSIQFKNKYPKADDNKFIKLLNEIARNSENPRISYKAQLAKLYFENTNLFNKIEVKSVNEEREVYKKISEKLNNIMIASDF